MKFVLVIIITDKISIYYMTGKILVESLTGKVERGMQRESLL